MWRDECGREGVERKVWSGGYRRESMGGCGGGVCRDGCGGKVEEPGYGGEGVGGNLGARVWIGGVGEKGV